MEPFPRPPIAEAPCPDAPARRGMPPVLRRLEALAVQELADAAAQVPAPAALDLVLACIGWDLGVGGGDAAPASAPNPAAAPGGPSPAGTGPASIPPRAR